MKTFYTLLCALTASLFLSETASSQCNYNSGGNGVSTATPAAITIDGNMNDWTTFLNDPDNNTYDNTSSIDLDAPISDAGRDLTRFTFTEDANDLYIYFQRAGSTNNSVDIIFYADINNNGVMESKEPVIHANWSGSNGSVSIDVYNYVPSLVSLLNSMISNLDGSPLMGTLLYRGSAGSASGRGSADGKSVELKIPFSKITQLNGTGTAVNQLMFGMDFKFHVSSINGNVSSIPNLNSINDNFGGCLKAPVSILPVKLISFQGNMNKDKVSLQWSVAENENNDHFEIERSTDAQAFQTAGIVMASDKSGAETYSFNETTNEEKIYYRLKMSDNSQVITYSKTLVFQNKTIDNGNALKIINNPATDKLTLSLSSVNNRLVEIKVYDLAGRLQMDQKLNLYQGDNLISLQLGSALTTGIYAVQVNNGLEKQTAKFVKQ